jgi:hypothetical protein
MPRCDEEAEDRARKQELDGCRERARAMPTATTVKELLAARPQRGDHVLEVRRRRCDPAQSRGIEWSAARSEEREGGYPAPDLKTAADNVPVRHAVCGQVQNRSEEEGAHRRTDDRAGRGTSRNVQGNDHEAPGRNVSAVKGDGEVRPEDALDWDHRNG